MEKTRVKILCTTDVHGYLDRGLAQLPQLKAKFETDILIDNGDFLVGSSFATFGYLKNSITPLVEVANELAYDVMIPGNHDLDYGLPWLKLQVTGLKAAYVCANLFDHDHKLVFEPYALIERHSQKIAVIGLMTHGLGQLLPEAVLGQVKTTSPETVLTEMLPKLSRIADIIIVAYHGGLTRDPIDGKVWHYPSLEDQAYELLASFPEIDSFICGHQHFKNVAVHANLGTAVIQPGAFGEVVGYQVFENLKGLDSVTLLENQLVSLQPPKRYVTKVDNIFEAWLKEAIDLDRLVHYIHDTYPSDVYLLSFESQTVEELAAELNLPFPLSEYRLTGTEVKNVLMNLNQQCDVKIPKDLIDHKVYKIIATPELIADDYLRKQFLVPLFNDFITS